MAQENLSEGWLLGHYIFTLPCTFTLMYFFTLTKEIRLNNALKPVCIFFLLEKEDNHENNFSNSKNRSKFRKT